MKNTIPESVLNVVARAKRAAVAEANKHNLPALAEGLPCEPVRELNPLAFYVAYIGDCDECSCDAIDAAERVLTDELPPLGYVLARSDYDEGADMWEFEVSRIGR